MTTLSTNIFSQAPAGIRRVGLGLFNFLVLLAEISPKYRAIQFYNDLSDEQLAEMGMTRADVVEKVFGSRSYL